MSARRKTSLNSMRAALRNTRHDTTTSSKKGGEKMSMEQCPVCGKILDDPFCVDCSAAWRKDLDAGRYPKGLQRRFYYFEYWIRHRLNEKDLREGKITQAEAERRAKAITQEAFDGQTATLAAEAERRAEKEARINAYLF